MDKSKSAIFEEIYGKNLDKVTFFAFNYLKDSEKAKEVAHDVFITLWENLSKIDSSKEVLGYLIILTRNKCINILRKERVKNNYETLTAKQKMEELSLYALNDRSASKLYEKELNGMIGRSLARMTSKLRETLLLSKIERLRHSQIASLQGISERAVEKRLKQAIMILRKDLKDYLNLFFLLHLLIK